MVRKARADFADPEDGQFVQVKENPSVAGLINQEV